MREYGLDASGSAGRIELEIDVEAHIRSTRDDVVVWQRHISRSEEAGRGMFGLGSEVDNVVTGAMLANLSEDQIRGGFERLARQTARDIALRLSRDLRLVR